MISNTILQIIKNYNWIYETYVDLIYKLTDLMVILKIKKMTERHRRKSIIFLTNCLETCLCKIRRYVIR